MFQLFCMTFLLLDKGVAEQALKKKAVARLFRKQTNFTTTMEAGNPLYGGASYNYSNGNEGNSGENLDPTELQYFQEQALQLSLQQQQLGGYLGQSNYQVDQSYSQSYLHKFAKAGGPLARGTEQVKDNDKNNCMYIINI